MKKISLASIPFLALTFLVGCNKTVEYKIDYGDTNGLMLSPSIAKKGVDYSGTFSVNTTLTDALLPDTINKVTSGNEEVKDFTYTPKEDRLSAEFKIPAASIVGDIVVNIDLVTHTVTKEEFENAISFKGVQYAQSSMSESSSSSMTGDTKKTVDYEFSPNKSHVTRTDDSGFGDPYNNTYTTTLGGIVYDLTKLNERKDWGDWTEMLEKELPTPENELGNSLVGTLVSAGLTFDKFEFKNGSYVANTELLGSTGTFTLAFENKKLVAYSNVSDFIWMKSDTKYTYSYIKNDIEFPVNPPATHTIMVPSGTKITPNIFAHGYDFTGTIEVIEADKSLPEEIGIPQEYFYYRNPGNKSAILTIPAQFTTDDIALKFELVDSVTKVDQDAFNNAVGFVDITNAQSQTSKSFVKPTTKDSSEPTPTTVKQSSEFLDGRSHLVSDTTESEKSIYVETYYSRIDNNSRYELTRNNVEDNWESIEWKKAAEATPTPQSDLSGDINAQFKLFGISTGFSAFTYDEQNRLYATKGKADGYGQVIISIKFEDNVISSFSVESEDKTSYMLMSTYSYKIEEIKFPKNLPFGL